MWSSSASLSRGQGNAGWAMSRETQPCTADQRPSASFSGSPSNTRVSTQAATAATMWRKAVSAASGTPGAADGRSISTRYCTGWSRAKRA